MNHKAPYEHLIAGKLELLPVPDMADSIWARIELQLDTDMPTDDGDLPLPEGPPVGGGAWSQALLFVTIIAIMSLFSIPKKNITAPIPFVTETIAPAKNNESNAQPPPAMQNSSTTGPQRNKPFAVGSQAVAGDSATALKVMPPSDTVIASYPIVQQQAPPPAARPNPQDTIPRKKPRGVPGINDGDYRIVPKKDSTGGN